MIPAKIYPCVIPAGGSLPLTIEGDYFKVLEATGLFEITGDSFGQLGSIVPGQGLQQTHFRRLTLRDLTGTQNTVRLLVAGQNFVDDRVQGDVAVIDGSKSRTISGAVFGAAPTASAVAAQLSFSQLYNPALSGKRLIVPAVSMACSTSICAFQVGILGASIAGADVTATRTRSLYSGGAQTVAELRVNNSAGNPLAASRVAWNMVLAAGVPWRHEPKQGPYVIEPGSGLLIVPTTGNVDTYHDYEYQEELL